MENGAKSLVFKVLATGFKMAFDAVIVNEEKDVTDVS